MAERLFDNGLCLSSGLMLTNEDIFKVTRKIKDRLKNTV